MCLPGFRWCHRFDRPAGPPYPLLASDKFRNYIIGMTELKLDTQPIIDHFRLTLSEDAIQAVLKELFPQPLATSSTSRAEYVLV